MMIQFLSLSHTVTSKYGKDIDHYNSLFSPPDHKSSGRVSVSPPPPSIRHQNIVAVAGTNCLPVVEESSALAFKRGDTIVVLERKGDALFTGTCHGKTGSFLAEDVTFYCGECW